MSKINDVLALVKSCGPITNREIAEKLEHEQRTINAKINTLYHRGFVDVSASEIYRGPVTVTITSAGSEYLKRGKPAKKKPKKADNITPRMVLSRLWRPNHLDISAGEA